ncbi:hypothetical protein [Streptomyces sp. YGL11-2]|uniref:hypothetical protein n=1 Tax=Streptomyces sp. YGL11-2 TaxID=3414028 RepID=UPI003CF74B7A
MLTDPSCYHAAVAALLRAVDPDADPFLVLGSNAATAVRLLPDGTPSFADPLEPLTETLARRGYQLAQHELRTTTDWQKALVALETGQTIAVAADPFFLKYYWVSYQRSHVLHAVVLTGYDPVTDTVRLLDPGEVVFFDDRVQLSALEPAMYSADHGQVWFELTPGERMTVTAGEYRALAENMAGAGSTWISGTEFLRTLAGQLDDQLASVHRQVQGRAGPGEVSEWLPLGLWWYHHTLRWLAKYIGAHHAHHTDRAGLLESVDRASRDVLVVRNLIMRLSVMPTGTSRARTFRGQLDTRLASALRDLETASAAIGGSA